MDPNSVDGLNVPYQSSNSQTQHKTKPHQIDWVNEVLKTIGASLFE